jgi:hypothetical protein
MPAGVLRESALIIWCELRELSKKINTIWVPKAFGFLFPFSAW